jgi:hypothetical protein
MTDMNKKTTKSNTKQPSGRHLSLMICCALSVVCCAARAHAKFEIIALPDTENYVDPISNAWVMTAQTQWIVDQKATENIVFVSQLGDLLHYAPATEIVPAKAMFDILDGGLPDAVVPYSVSRGNHDTSQQFEDNFDENRYKEYSWYGDGDNTTVDSFQTYNHYQTFSAEGYEFLHINLEKGASGDILTWAQTVVDANLGKPTIISTHDYLDLGANRSSAGNAIWNGLVKDNSQIFMTLSAHKHNSDSSSVHLLSENTAGESVLQILADFEDYEGPTGETDSGYLSRIIFDPDAETISVKTFSPTYTAVPYLTDSGHQYSFDAEFLPQTNGVASRSIGVFSESAPPDDDDGVTTIWNTPLPEIGRLEIYNGSTLIIEAGAVITQDTGQDTYLGGDGDGDHNGRGTIIQTGGSFTQGDDLKCTDGGAAEFYMQGGTHTIPGYLETDGDCLFEFSGGSFIAGVEDGEAVRDSGATFRVIGNGATLIQFDAIEGHAANFEFFPTAAGLITAITSGDTQGDTLAVNLDALTPSTTMTLFQGGWVEVFGVDDVTITQGLTTLSEGAWGALGLNEYALDYVGGTGLALSFNVGDLDPDVSVVSNVVEGDWNTPESWLAPGVPTANSGVTILDGHEITLQTGEDAGVANTLAIDGTLNANNELTVTGEITIASTGALNIDADGVMNGGLGLAITGGAVTVASGGSATLGTSVSIDSGGVLDVNGALDGDNLNITDGTVTVAATTGTLSLTGDVSVDSGGVLDVNGALGGDNLNITGGTVTVAATTGTLSLTGDVSVDSGSLLAYGALTAQTVTTAGTFTATGATGTIAQLDVTDGTTTLASTTITNLNILGGTVNTTGAATVTGHLQVDSGSLNLTGGSLSVETMEAPGGGDGIDASDNALVVSQTATLGELTITATTNAFELSGANLLDVPTPKTVTLTGGTVTMTAGTEAAAPNIGEITGLYRLAFVASTNVPNAAGTAPGDTNMASLNAWVTSMAQASGAVDDGGALGTTWSVVGATSTVNVFDNTDTEPGVDTDTSIYLVDGTLFAADLAAFWAPASASLNVNEQGGSSFGGSTAIHTGLDSGPVTATGFELDAATMHHGGMDGGYSPWYGGTTWHTGDINSTSLFAISGVIGEVPGPVGINLPNTTVVATATSTLALPTDLGSTATLGGIQTAGGASLTIDSPSTDIRLTNLTLGGGSMVRSTQAVDSDVSLTVSGKLTAGDGVSELGDSNLDDYDTNLTLSDGATFDWVFGPGENQVDILGLLTLEEGDLGITINIIAGLGTADGVDVDLFSMVNDPDDLIIPSNIVINTPDGWDFDALVQSDDGEFLVLTNLITSGVVAPVDGDANGDRDVDVDDLAIFKAQFGGPLLAGDYDPDFDNDGFVTLADFAIMRGNWGATSGEAPSVEDLNATPEPATMSLLAIGGLLVLRRRRRKA